MTDAYDAKADSEKPDRISQLRRYYWSEIARMQAEIKQMEQKLALLDEMEKDLPNETVRHL